MSAIIQVKDLTKYYGNVKAVDGISFRVEEGQLFAFLGPNGAGKSTTIDIISTLLKPDSGKVRVNGYTLGENNQLIKSSIGVVFQTGLLDHLLTVRENLRIRGSFYSLDKEQINSRIEAASEAVSLSDFIDRPYGKLSGGQKRRADIARALINQPKILFLDEPTTGLDPQTRKNVWETIRSLQQQTGMTIFLTTHYMEEAAAADYIVVIDHGKVAAAGTPEALKEQYSSDRLILYTKDPKAVFKKLCTWGLTFEQKGAVFSVPVASTFDALPVVSALTPWLDNFEIHMGSMDDTFIHITGKEMRS
ncbi:Methionine ABC transporter ATP-binding protein [Alkalibacterium sp. AK22]|uniref:ABC transporter ATP-binding protein n=1 Tax=Alkalibacterium sp. AK22 TaxID=1229520 RepID=UPI00044A5DA9|nr:ABC transporter ATP-binding protein [Alkalibacterium sp. AK22]EXJ23053.1 Methionine ABC transporter ATP-binding protein [Alkalibacterium sp. AK22]